MIEHPKKQSEGSATTAQLQHGQPASAQHPVSGLVAPLLPIAGDGALSPFSNKYWVDNNVTPGSHPESIHVAVNRHLAGALGRKLGENTGNVEEAVATVGLALRTTEAVPVPGALVGDVVEAVGSAGKRDRAAEDVFRVISDRLAELGLNDWIERIVGSMRESMGQMFSELFKHPELRRNAMKVTGEGNFSTVFSAQGDVQSMRITMAQGDLGQYFAQELKKAVDEYQMMRAGLIKRRTTKREPLFEVTLTLFDGKGHEVKQFKTTKDGLFEAYMSAHLRYASEGEPWRAGRRKQLRAQSEASK